MTVNGGMMISVVGAGEWNGQPESQDSLCANDLSL